MRRIVATKNLKSELLGEFMGTFILTFLGTASVAVAVLFGEYGSIFQIGIVWGLAVTLAIYLTRHICPAHLNPAVSVAKGWPDVWLRQVARWRHAVARQPALLPC